MLDLFCFVTQFILSHYGLFVGCHVFTNKDDAIKLIKEKKGGRFKAFSNRLEAQEFSLNVPSSSCLTFATETVVAVIAFHYTEIVIVLCIC